ncbi:MAG TPA: hypothetical protein VLE02_02780 [Nitrosarchaeum sp.]|nr:hypothetical protein [Nitrosarchaeum sp.]
MGDEEKSNIVSEEIQRQIFCPCCGGKLQGLIQGKKDKCGYDDCRAVFSLRIYDYGNSEE